jgi:hypothetical protein
MPSPELIGWGVKFFFSAMKIVPPFSDKLQSALNDNS